MKTRADRAESLQLAAVTQCVDQAIAERKILAAQRDHYIQLGKAAGDVAFGFHFCYCVIVLAGSLFAQCRAVDAIFGLIQSHIFGRLYPARQGRRRVYACRYIQDHAGPDQAD